MTGIVEDLCTRILEDDQGFDSCEDQAYSKVDIFTVKTELFCFPTATESGGAAGNMRLNA